MKPVIGISGSIIIDQGGRFPGYKRAYVNDTYVQSVLDAGGVPFIVPVINDEETIDQMIQQIDGLVMSGGHDVNPLLYGEEPLAKQGSVFPERDEFDQLLIKKAIAAGKPVFAICRGLQILNVAFGGSIYQDLSYIENASIKHDQYNNTEVPTHTIDIEPGTHLHSVFGDTALVNSFHHQAIKDVAPGFLISARARDKVIEAIEMESSTFVLGVQWHPEMLTKGYPLMLKLFETLVEKAEQQKAAVL
ncbi:gamma-glutamyl-gamma-aminobutyrate hydrolase family protein [Bacillus vallismortis]|uniref:Gamma-glutamyl-gamma-aminobutyrate hydrolase family protein n=1 Tax=Bacillus vallismortis TaxID=72361 RepID=A0AAP3CL63_BACVA|nr:gamma-glutamyl-gamma-aminobutyrate hydrolase family protein [Bacillus vallismortis]MCI3986539.1 gamma-glutamyl-gamma-aminobutyrate hydrolase family protein [Bacillus vallismortis]MCY8310822.1 gamma-glutamyl-gamma-aminobutyrate hydrolase family protein [Bacillus vallismortis]MCY8318402.1 gamma-glutamyl-gamma-aminobutyrate hydrolase family protein [Bacillus vallismortis]MCY8598283.1 gamma-glutamyl-gamma-aminobutyrate hydrolase family protein [Bacillus vallismortis]MEC1653031.1 gamma-glutamyl-